MKKLLLITVAFFTFNLCANAQNDVMMQAFYWNLPVDDATNNGTWWDSIAAKSSELKSAGFSGLWVPPPSKGNWGIVDMGYGIYDHYDLGNYYQKGSTETRFGSRSELENMISVLHASPKIEVYADIILNHVYSDDSNEEVNPAVKSYVFNEAYTGGVQHVPYPTNEIKWVIPNAGTGDYYVKIKGYYLDYSMSYTERGYDLQIDWTGGGFNSTYSWEAEPNNGDGDSNTFPATGQTIRGHIDYEGDVDEFIVTLTNSNDIVIKLTSKREIADPWEWVWADQTRGYYPFEIWHNGQNLASTALQARTNTNISYPNHTGTGEANVTWGYADFHPVDEYDWLGDWGTDEIIPNTKGFGNDFNSYSSVVQGRMNDWGYWLSDQIQFDGFRLDFVRGFQESYAASWVNNLPLLDGNQRFIVGEYWGADYRIKDWVNAMDSYGADADGFDFPLKSSLTSMCNGDQSSFDMRWLNHAGMVRNDQGNALPGTSVVTFLDNHDTGKEHDKWVTKDWKMAYAYMLTHEGRPCVFYPHYYGVTLVDNSDTTITVTPDANLKDDLNKLIFIRKTYLGGTLAVLSEVGNPYPSADAYNVYVARRQGNGTKDGAIVVINNSSSTKGLWVDATPSGFSNWSNTTLKNALTGSTTTVYSDGRVWVEAPARGYAVYVLESDYVAYGSKSVVTSVDINKANDIKVYPNPFTSSTKISFNISNKANVDIRIIDISGREVATLFSGVKDAGKHEFIWNPEKNVSGMYFAKIKINEQNKTIKLMMN